MDTVENFDRRSVESIISSIKTDLGRLETMLGLGAADDSGNLDPRSPLNKIGNNLTPRGVEVCYRLFDQGKSRYAVAHALGISFGAATHRFHAWEKLGGTKRKRNPLS